MSTVTESDAAPPAIADPNDVNDVIMVLDNVLYALLARRVAGEYTFDELTQMTRRAVIRLIAPFS
jgi:hypothetical protein